MKRVALLIFLMTTPALAHDAEHPEFDGWFQNLHSEKGYCCSDSDGNVIKDTEWQSVNDPAKPNVHYRVKIKDAWVDVPDAAVLNMPNLYGQTMVWPFYKDGEPQVRCFILGPGL
jgi:hypothetical protein